MRKIKFSHEYGKMPRILAQVPTYLIGVQLVERDILPSHFVIYDTTYDTGMYDLPNGKLLILFLFNTDGFEPFGHVWTTVRRWTPQKEEYYRGLVGKEVEISIEKGKTP